jgi:hypothetical protein
MIVAALGELFPRHLSDFHCALTRAESGIWAWPSKT